MTLEGMAAALNAIPTIAGKVAYNDFPDEIAPAMPFVCYRVDQSNNFGADNRAYYKQLSVDIELYTKTKDINAETSIEEALDNMPLYWEKYETYIDTEHCFEVVYTVTI